MYGQDQRVTLDTLLCRVQEDIGVNLSSPEEARTAERLRIPVCGQAPDPDGEAGSGRRSSRVHKARKTVGEMLRKEV